MMRSSSRVAYAPLQNEAVDERGRKSTDELESVELRARGRGRSRRSDDEDDRQRSDSAGSSNGTVYLERVIQEGDTLQKIALQYSIQVSELKRANNLLSEQDFYGLKLLRIPVSKYSSVHETVVDEQKQLPSTSHAAVPLPSNFVLTDKLISLSDDDETMASSPLIKPASFNAYIVARVELQPCSSMHDRALASSSWGFGDGEAAEGSAHKDFEKMLSKVDASLQQAREKADELERNTQLEEAHGFHFIDATEPKTAHWFTSPWMLFVLVIVIFVVVPMWVTIYELMNAKNDTSGGSFSFHSTVPSV